MDWLIFAVLSPLFWAVNSVVIKIFIENDKRFGKPFPYAMLLTFIDVILIIGVGLAFPISMPFPGTVYALLLGVFVAYTFYFFFNAMKRDEGSRAMSLMQTSPAIVAVLSAVFLGEILAPSQYLGIALLVFASILVSHKRLKSGNRVMSPSLKYALGYAVMVALASIAVKYLLGGMDYWSLFFWSTIGVVLNMAILFVIPSIRKDFFSFAKSLDRKTVLICIGKEFLWFMGQVAFLIAVALGPVSMVSAVGAIEPFLVLLLATGLSMYLPSVLKEDMGRGHMTEKLAATVLIFAGLWLLMVV